MNGRSENREKQTRSEFVLNKKKAKAAGSRKKMIRQYLRSLFKYNKGGLRYRTMLKALMVAGLCATMAYSRVWLLFDIKDKRITTAQLQDLAMRREQTQLRLANQLRELQRGNRLLSVARDELKMVSPSPTEIDNLIVSKEMQEEYDLAAVRQDETTGGDADPERGGLAVLVTALTSLDARR